MIFLYLDLDSLEQQYPHFVYLLLSHYDSFHLKCLNIISSLTTPKKFYGNFSYQELVLGLFSSIIGQIQDAYDKVIHWHRNVFWFPLAALAAALWMNSLTYSESMVRPVL